MPPLHSPPTPHSQNKAVPRQPKERLRKARIHAVINASLSKDYLLLSNYPVSNNTQKQTRRFHVRVEKLREPRSVH